MTPASRRASRRSAHVEYRVSDPARRSTRDSGYRVAVQQSGPAISPLWQLQLLALSHRVSALRNESLWKAS